MCIRDRGSNATASTLRAEIAKLLNISIDNLFIVPVAESSSSTGTTNEVEIAFTFEADANGALVEADAGNLGSAGVYLSLIHISEPTRLLSISYAVFCLKKKKKKIKYKKTTKHEKKED
eukprot:TRINITY_DN15860_c0_g1_i1.p1 TRINITY_DN15860_c0_g1~~TRINITY_DN15860_c0_g1_i1.p1  ORF type:complete len:130 (-),score=60.15 TRINITY_DN15860_c0_g1_i1:18-374(-)